MDQDVVDDPVPAGRGVAPRVPGVPRAALQRAPSSLGTTTSSTWQERRPQDFSSISSPRTDLRGPTGARCRPSSAPSRSVPAVLIRHRRAGWPATPRGLPARPPGPATARRSAAPHPPPADRQPLVLATSGRPPQGGRHPRHRHPADRPLRRRRAGGDPRRPRRTTSRHGHRRHHRHPGRRGPGRCSSTGGRRSSATPTLRCRGRRRRGTSASGRCSSPSSRTAHSTDPRTTWCPTWWRPGRPAAKASSSKTVLSASSCCSWWAARG